MGMHARLGALVVLASIGAVASPSRALDAQHREQGETIARQAEAFLRSQQDAKTGGWSVPTDEKSPTFPAISGLVLTGMLMAPDADTTGQKDKVIGDGLRFILSHRQKDGGIYDRLLPSYNTSVCLSALSLARSREAAEAIVPAQDFLRRLQWSETAAPPTDPASGIGEATTDKTTPEAPTKVTREHPFYGGIGYGRHGRPDLSNLQLMLQGLHDSGLPQDDEAFRRALVFLSRVQMLETTSDGATVNDMPYAKDSRQGGFIYSTSLNRDAVGSGQTMVDEKAAMVEETLDDGTKVSRLRCYGSMTYSGFKSLIYAGLTKDDPRVRAAYEWARRNYTLEENPGVGTDGVYYYLLAFARAMRATGEARITPIDSSADPSHPGGVTSAAIAGKPREWAADLIDRLAALQNPDGSFKSLDDRWMENNPALITAYSLIAVREALK